MPTTNLKYKLTFPRACLFWLLRKALFIHIPRAAGTSVSRALYGRTLGHYRAEFVARLCPRLFRSSYVFAVVRNPWSRLLSAYQFARAGGTADMGMHKPGQYRIPEFDSFARFLEEWLAPRDPKSLDFVFQPQSVFLCDAQGRLLVPNLFRIEHLAQEWPRLQAAVPGTPALTHVNRTAPEVNWREAYAEPWMIARAAEKYRMDIDLLGYRFEDFER